MIDGKPAVEKKKADSSFFLLSASPGTSRIYQLRFLIPQGLERGKAEEIRQEKVLLNWHQSGIGLHRDWRVCKIDSFSCGCLFIDLEGCSMPAPGLLSDPLLLYLPCISTELASLGFTNWRCWTGIGRWVGGRSQGTSPHHFPSCGLSSSKWLHFLRESVLLKSPALIPASFWWSQPMGSNITTPHFALQPEDVMVSCSFQSLGYLSIPFLVLSSSVTCVNSSLQ